MSSHHFVREGQEPALLILDPLQYSVAEGLLEWAPLVVVAHSALEETLLWGIKIDVVIAHESLADSLAPLLADQAPVKIVSSASNDVTQSALLFLLNSNQGAVCILSQALHAALKDAIEQIDKKLQVTVRTPREKWSWIQSGIFKKWLQAGSIIDFSDKSLASTAGRLKQIANGFEVVEDQWISIQNPAPFWVAEIV